MKKTDFMFHKYSSNEDDSTYLRLPPVLETKAIIVFQIHILWGLHYGMVGKVAICNASMPYGH